MGLVTKDTFVCFDCEATGLDPEKDRIIEIATAKFTFDGIIESREDLINPGILIPQHTIEIHHITDDMVQGKPSNLLKQRHLDTLRLARLYGESPTNSLESLRKHFNIKAEGAHRAMSDVLVNIEVFKHLSRKFKTTEEMLKRLEKPITLKLMPLGKHKGRPFREVPVEYLRWAANQSFDQDLLFSLRSELKKRKTGNQFSQAANPFSEL